MVLATPCCFKIEPGPAPAVGPQAPYKPRVDRKMLANRDREEVKYAYIIYKLIQENFLGATLSKQGLKNLMMPGLCFL